MYNKVSLKRCDFIRDLKESSNCACPLSYLVKCSTVKRAGRPQLFQLEDSDPYVKGSEVLVFWV